MHWKEPHDYEGPTALYSLGFEDAIVVPAVLADQFELKPELLDFISNNPFFSLENDDPHSHIRRFYQITQTLKLNHVPDDVVKLILFPFSLKGAAETWLENEPPCSITTWDDLVSKFLNRFYPHSKTKELRKEIKNFQQVYGETFTEAWERFKDLLRKYLLNKCPHHGFSPLHQIDTFYNNLNQFEQDSLNSAANGNFLTKNIIENKSKVQTSRNKPQVASASGSSTQDAHITSLTKQVKAFISLHRPVNSIQNSCETMVSLMLIICQAPGGKLKRTNILPTVTYNARWVEVEKEPETLMDEVHITSPTSTAHVPHPRVQPVSPPKPKEDPKPNLHQPKIPYPSRLNKTKLHHKNDVQISKFLKILKQLHFDISLTDALTQIPKFTKVLKDLLKDKEKLEELANTSINAECSTILLNKVPEKLEDPGKFPIPCILQDLEVCNSLSNSGASIILVPLSIYEKLRIGPLKHTQMTLELANCMLHSDGTYHLRRPFLCTARALVDLYEEKLTLRVGNEKVMFYTDKSSRNNLSDIPSVHCINIIDFSRDKPIIGSTTFPSDSSPSSLLVNTSDSLLEEFADELALLDPFPLGNKDDNFDPEADLRKIEYLLNQDPSIESSHKSDIKIIDPILERFTDEPAPVYSPPLGDDDDDDDDLFDLKSDNDEWKKLLYEESSESSEIATFLSSPFENEDMVFNPGIFILGETQIFNNESKDKDSKFTVLDLLSFSFENEDKVFNPGILTSKGVHSFTLGLSHRTYETFKNINVHANILNEGSMKAFPSFVSAPRQGIRDIKLETRTKQALPGDTLTFLLSIFLKNKCDFIAQV
ncbi:reverse transcriptase domain-containing protein [Tanacetum coccineum]